MPLAATVEQVLDAGSITRTGKDGVEYTLDSAWAESHVAAGTVKGFVGKKSYLAKDLADIRGTSIEEETQAMLDAARTKRLTRTASAAPAPEPTVVDSSTGQSQEDLVATITAAVLAALQGK